jgi:peptidoglycan/LPS O-acetylase OafA/YrhL
MLFICSTKQSKSHILIIDSLRGLAVLAVCLFHFISENDKLSISENFQNTFVFGAKGVQVFFVISSIVLPLVLVQINYKLKSFFRFLLRRLVRLEPVYLFSILAIIIISWLISFSHNGATTHLPSYENLSWHLAYLIPFTPDGTWINPVYWSLGIEFQYYIALGILFPLALNKKWHIRALFYFLFLIAPFWINDYEFFTHWSAYFLFGLAYLLWSKKIIKPLEFLMVGLLSLSVIILKLELFDAILALLTVLVVHLFRNQKVPGLHQLGLISYSLYLFHTIIGTKVQSFILNYNSSSGWQVLSIVLALVSSIAASYLVYLIVEKPTTRLSKKVNYKKLNSGNNA